MNRILSTAILLCGFLSISASADGLKNALINMESESSSSNMMGLDSLNLGTQPKKRVQQLKKRSPNTVLATVNGHKIHKKDADKYLKKVTKGKIKDYDLLPEKQRKLLLTDLKNIYKAKYFKGRPGDTVIGHHDDNTSVYKKEADAYIKKVTEGKIKDIDRLPRKQRLLILEDLQKIYRMEHFKGRPKDTIIATVNEFSIIKSDADDYIARATRGSIKDFDMLDKKQKHMLVQDLARPVLLASEADNNMSIQEKEAFFKQVWLEKQMATIEVSNEEMLALYESMQAKALAENPNAKIPPYISFGEQLKKKIIEEKVMATLMKDVQIEVNYDDAVTPEANTSNESSKN